MAIVVIDMFILREQFVVYIRKSRAPNKAHIRSWVIVSTYPQSIALYQKSVGPKIPWNKAGAQGLYPFLLHAS